MAVKRKKHRGSSLDDFLEEEGVLDEFTSIAEKEVIAWQFAEAMKQRGLSKARMAAEMKTSRTQVDRLLDPKSGNVTLTTMRKAARVLGKKLNVELA
jgi:DNA-binding Xre family transcriptional regulator